MLIDENKSLSEPLSEELFMVAQPDEGQVVDPMAWFDEPGPFELEIGSGTGGFLIDRALANPDIRMLGIEWANKYYRSTADRLARRRAINARVMRTDAKIFVLRHLPASCISTLHIYHPDPWPKKRHHKRRLIQADFVDAAIRAIKSGGYWRLQTDHAEYFEQMCEQLKPRKELTEIDFDTPGVGASEDWQGTNFEIKYKREERSIYRLAFQKQ